MATKKSRGTKQRSKTKQHITLTSKEREARWQALTLADDFLFSKIMAEPVLCRELIHRIFPQLEITDLSPVQVQKTVKLALHLRGVRFDVFTVMARNIFDLEMQKERLKDLFRRTHAYHIVGGQDALNIADLKKSGNYENLPDVYVVFICLFDPFSEYNGCERHIYPFEMRCTVEPNIALNDGIHTVFLNAKGTKDDVSPELKRFLDFVAMNKIITENGENADPFINVLDQRVKEAKENIKWRRELCVQIGRNYK